MKNGDELIFQIFCKGMGIMEKDIEIDDYTKWRQDQFDDMSLSELNDAAAEYERKHPFKGNAEVL